MDAEPGLVLLFRGESWSVGWMRGVSIYLSVRVCRGALGTSKCVRKGSFIDSTFHILSRMHICSIKKNNIYIYIYIFGGNRESSAKRKELGWEMGVGGGGGRELPSDRTGGFAT